MTTTILMLCDRRTTRDVTNEQYDLKRALEASLCEGKKDKASVAARREMRLKIKELSAEWLAIYHATPKCDTRIWGNYKLRTRYSTGFAAHRNRGSYSGTKIHRIRIEEVVEVIDASIEPAKGTVGRWFLNGHPAVFSISPMCGCTGGQNAAREVANQTVTCEKCGGAS
jgi:hypothetical protein